MELENFYSPNYSKKNRPKNLIKIIVIHYTGMQSERESIIRLCNPSSKVSSHFFISESGKIFRLIEDYKIAWHAGKSCWGKYKNINKNSIGIELANKGHRFGYTNFKKKQILSLIKICKRLCKKYKIKKENVVGHSDVAPLRKIDPGEKFPWKQLAVNGVGKWHSCESKLLNKYRKVKVVHTQDKKKFIKNLKKLVIVFLIKEIFCLLKQ